MGDELPAGLYEQLITEGLRARLARTGADLHAEQAALGTAEAADRFALHLSRAVERSLYAVVDADRLAKGQEVVAALLDRLEELVADPDLALDQLIEPAQLLRALLRINPDGSPRAVAGPMIPLLDTTLLTNAPGEPSVGSQVRTEIASADRIDLVMAFIRRTGVNPLMEPLRRHCADGNQLRILTTTYTDSTELRALESLQELGAEVRISYDVSTTRLHAKSWLFHRASGYSTAYIGSSNLTFSAQVSGLEWNMRVSEARNRAVIEKVGAVFDSYWENGEFRPFTTEEFVAETRQRRRSGPEVLLSPIELRPEPFQERLLEQIAVARAEGHHRNLLVAATGTGKTVMAAVDYARLRPTLARDRLLFVAHTKEILQQSLNTFRYALRDPTFGELWVDGARPEQFEHVFASVQSLRSAGTANLDRDHYDVVVVDEFHHAAASSYRALLDHVDPIELIGLTATPERADGISVLDWFDGRIAAELRLWEAIDQQRLVPFAYFGIADGTTLESIPWRRGRGYDTAALTNLYTGDNAWARLVVASLLDRIDDHTTMRALGFCVSVAHAQFMAAHFRDAGIAAIAVSGETPAVDRRQALDDLRAGRINVVFSVDLFNEGVDLPDVDTLLLLRPTDSPVLFVQQLGRGLRRAANKVNCLVLDFVGQHRKEFRYDRRFRALLGGTRRQLQEQIADDFPFLPSGCHLELDPVATTTILRNIKESLPSTLAQRLAELRVIRDLGGEVTLANYLDETGLDLEDVVTSSRGWSDLLDAGGVETLPPGPHEVTLRRAAGRLTHIDDRRRIDRYRSWVGTGSAPIVDELPMPSQRELRMLVASVTDRAIDKAMPLQAAADLLWRHPQVLVEIDQLLDVLSQRIEHLHPPLRGRPDVPLQMHAQYSRIEILAAFGVGEATKVAPWQSGVYLARDARADLLAFTLDKSSGGFSPTTRYRDYAVSRDLIHWESQGVTRADSETGRRYQHHVDQGSDIMLFARHRNDDRAFWFLGPATYVRHISERPMQITWRLHHPLPGDLYASFAAAAV